MCSWWVSIEWYRKWPGYHGLGRYNMQNAWKLDHVLDSAEKHGMYIQLVTTNHGQFSNYIDREFEFNPLFIHEPDDPNLFRGDGVGHQSTEQHLPEGHNRGPGQPPERRLIYAYPNREPQTPPPAPGYRRPKGLLAEARDFFEMENYPRGQAAHAKGVPYDVGRNGYSNDQHLVHHRNKMRYIIARWGYSPNIMSFILFSEVEWLEEYWVHIYGKESSVWNRYKNGGYLPKTAFWHKEMYHFMKTMDQGRHMVTTHMSHPHRGHIYWDYLPELEYVQSNAYSVFSFACFGGTYREYSGHGAAHALSAYYRCHMAKFNRPVIVGEFGRTSHGDLGHGRTTHGRQYRILVVAVCPLHEPLRAFYCCPQVHGRARPAPARLATLQGQAQP